MRPPRPCLEGFFGFSGQEQGAEPTEQGTEHIQEGAQVLEGKAHEKAHEEREMPDAEQEEDGMAQAGQEQALPEEEKESGPE